MFSGRVTLAVALLPEATRYHLHLHLHFSTIAAYQRKEKIKSHRLATAVTHDARRTPDPAQRRCPNHAAVDHRPTAVDHCPTPEIDGG
jgi:hypothetical protein